jgi:hypothetical protein
LSKKKEFGLFNLAISSVVVFEGDPAVMTQPPLFLSSQQIYLASVEEELNEAERIGRAFISTLR